MAVDRRLLLKRGFVAFLGLRALGTAAPSVPAAPVADFVAVDAGTLELGVVRESLTASGGLCAADAVLRSSARLLLASGA